MVQEYSDDNRILILENFDEVEQPYTCEQWGAFAEENLPMIFTDGTPAWDFFLWDLFSLNCSAGTIVIDHNMRIRHVLDYFPSDTLNSVIIPELLVELEESISDINGDGLINILDIISLVNLILYNSLNEFGDVNQDGQINILDIMVVVNIILDT